MINEKIKRLLLEFNPFWKAPFSLNYKERHVYQKIQALLKEPQIIALCGLRRTGKTTLLRKIISDLLKTVPSDAIIYFSFDDVPDIDILDILDAYHSIHGKKHNFLFLILDEVQKLPNWAEKIKIIYDMRKYKIIVSGSESLLLRTGSRESLAGRLYECEVHGLTFTEYLHFVGKKHYAQKPLLYEQELQKELTAYLRTGSFPELLGKDSASLVCEYLKTAILEKIIFFDMPRLYPIDEPAILQRIMSILFDRPGMLVDFVSFSNELGISRQTLSRYFEYLEFAHLVKKMYNYSKNKSTSEKRLKKFYPAFHSPFLGDEKDAPFYSKIVETVCALQTPTPFFWRSKYKDEVDIVIQRKGELIPVEIKYRNMPERENGIKQFCKTHSCDKAIIVTKNMHKESTGFPSIRWIPAYEYLLSVSEERP